MLGDYNIPTVGDVVSRGCNDEHMVEEVYFGSTMLKVKCIKTQDGDLQWTDVGDIEHNLARRYTLVRRTT